jgi:hypothetical protein
LRRLAKELRRMRRLMVKKACQGVEEGMRRLLVEKAWQEVKEV